MLSFFVTLRLVDSCMNSGYPIIYDRFKSLLRLDRATFYVYSVPSGPEFKRVDLVNQKYKMAVSVTLADLF